MKQILLAGATLLALTSLSHGQSNTPSQVIRPEMRVVPRGPQQPQPQQQPQEPQIPAAYTTRLNCPDGTKLLVNIPDSRKPPGWTDSIASGALAVIGVDIASWQGKQDLRCRYSGDAQLRHFVNPDSCVVGTDKKSFMCKPGVN